MIVAVPYSTEVTRPADDTVATEAADVVHVTMAPSSTSPFPFTTVAIEIDDSAVTNVTGATIDLALGMDTARRFLQGSATKGQPKRSSVPEYSGTLTAEFASLSDYNNFIGGSSHKVEIIATQTTAIDTGLYPYVHITCPAVRFEGSSPQASLDGLTTIELPFKILDNGTDAAVTVATQSTDTSF